MKMTPERRATLRRNMGLPPYAFRRGATMSFDDLADMLDDLDEMERLGEALPNDLRALGWCVAVHNDYRIDGAPHTFWLVTKDGRALKGEGRTDADALEQIRAALVHEREAQPAAGRRDGA